MIRFTKVVKRDLRKRADIAKHEVMLIGMAAASRQRALYAEDAMRIQDMIEELIKGIEGD